MLSATVGFSWRANSANNNVWLNATAATAMPIWVVAGKTGRQPLFPDETPEPEAPERA